MPTAVGALLLRAAKRGSLLLVRALLSHPSCDLMARDEEGNTALHLAASRGYCDIVEELASTTTGTPKEDLIINGQGTWNCSALVECRNYCGNTPLLVASKEGKFEIAKLYYFQSIKQRSVLVIMPRILACIWLLCMVILLFLSSLLESTVATPVLKAAVA